MTSGERIRYFRKEISHMTQVEFAEKLNISRANVANIEKGRISLTERMLSAICNAFSLSEEWILTGKGEMHQETETTLFNAFAKQYNLTPAEQRVARYLLQLTSEDRQQLIKHIIGLAKAVDEPSKTTAAVPSPEDEREALHRELDAALDAEKKAASASSATFSVIKNQ